MQEHHQKHNDNSYNKLLIMGILSFISMYILMYSMVDRFEHVIPNINQFYMAGVMAMPMMIIEILLMKDMYKNSKLNTLVIAISSIALIGFYMGIRKQVAVSDKQFLKSMIPHHSGAILMCDEANLNDPEVKKLCEEIVESQKKEIEQMNLILERLKKQNK